MDYSEIMKEYSEWRGNCLLAKLFEMSETSCGCSLIDDPRKGKFTSWSRSSQVGQIYLPFHHQNSKRLFRFLVFIQIFINTDGNGKICEPDDILRCSLSQQLYEDPTQLPTMFEMLKINGRGASTRKPIKCYSTTDLFLDNTS